jgi:SAM-dependent methyltransferase
MPDLPPPSDHLLRTMAAVPVSSSVLDLGCGRGRHTGPLLRLGFPVHACDPRPEAVEATRRVVADLIGEEDAQTCVRRAGLDALDYAEETFNWVVAHRTEVFANTDAELGRLLARARRLVVPGGWIYVSAPASEDDVAAAEGAGGNGAEEEEVPAIERLEAQRRGAALALASEPEIARDAGSPRVRAIYRRVDR